jgi:hypothetical protein
MTFDIRGCSALRPMEGEIMEPTKEQLQQRLNDAKDYLHATKNREHEATLRRAVAEAAVERIKTQIDATQPS